MKCLKQIKTLFLVILFIGCKTYNTPLTKEETKIIKEKFSLSKKEFKQVRTIDSIIGQLKAFVPIKDTLKIHYANKRLDSFFLNDYSIKKTYFTIYAERILRDKFTDLSFDKEQFNDGRPEFENPEEIKAYLELMEKQFNKSFKEGLKKKGTIKKQ